MGPPAEDLREPARRAGGSRSRPIAAVREGDSITIDIEHGRIDLDLPAEALAQRLTEYVPPPPRYWSGVFVKYVATVLSAAQGAITCERFGFH